MDDFWICPGGWHILFTTVLSVSYPRVLGKDHPDLDDFSHLLRHTPVPNGNAHRMSWAFHQ